MTLKWKMWMCFSSHKHKVYCAAEATAKKPGEIVNENYTYKVIIFSTQKKQVFMKSR